MDKYYNPYIIQDEIKEDVEVLHQCEGNKFDVDKIYSKKGLFSVRGFLYGTGGLINTRKCPQRLTEAARTWLNQGTQ